MSALGQKQTCAVQLGMSAKGQCGNAEPGSWQLCCKRGADGKDGKGAA